MFRKISQHSLKLLSIVKSNYDICDNNLYEKEESRRSSNISKINHDQDKGRKISKAFFLALNSSKKTKKKSMSNNLFVTPKNEFSNSPIHEFKVLKTVFNSKKQGLKCFLK